MIVAGLRNKNEKKLAQSQRTRISGLSSFDPPLFPFIDVCHPCISTEVSMFFRCFMEKGAQVGCTSPNYECGLFSRRSLYWISCIHSLEMYILLETKKGSLTSISMVNPLWKKNWFSWWSRFVHFPIPPFHRKYNTLSHSKCILIWICQCMQQC